MFGARGQRLVGVVLGSRCAALLVIGCSGRTEIGVPGYGEHPNAGSPGTNTRDASAPDATASGHDAAAATCPSGTMLCGGVCVDVAYDPQNCGACGTACALGQLCSAGTCGTACLGGSLDCGDRCVDPENDPANCGTCGHACDAGSICSRGACTLGCSGGATECDGRCSDLQNDPIDCGACGAACNVGEYCSAGHCVPTCPAPLQVCDGACTDTTNNPNHCGSCDVACPAGLVCSNETCNLECGGGTTKCADACVLTASDPSNCGSCGNACAENQHCANGVCAACAAGKTQCNGVCVDLQSDTANCGSCAKTCPYAYYGTVACQNGTCGGNCYNGYGTCPNATYACSTNLMADTSNCGSCGNACATGEVCTSGVCTACTSGKTACSAACVDLTRDPYNCGSCGAACPYRSGATPACVSSMCQSTCYQGYADCDGNATNGCEVSVAGDRKNCGACGKACGSNEVCTQGTCTACVPGSAVCGNTCANLQSDPSNCGSCAVTCGAGSAHATTACKSGACALSCNAGYLDCDGNNLDGCETTADKTHCGSCTAACAAGTFCAVTKCAKCSPTDLGQVVPVAINGTTAGAADSFVTTCGQNGQGDAYFSFTAPAAKSYTFTLSATYGQIMEIENGSCGGAVLSCAYGTSPQSLTMTAKQTVIVIVESYYNGGGAFTLTVQ